MSELQEKWAAFEAVRNNRELTKAAARALMLAVHGDDCWACRRGLKECPRRRKIEQLGK